MKATEPWQRRADRAAVLRDQYPATREILSFYARLAVWQRDAAPAVRGFADLGGVAESLLDLVRGSGPPALASLARELTPAGAGSLAAQNWESPGTLNANEFFARALLGLYAAALPGGIDCPWCALPPLAGCLRPQGDGLALELICALCFRGRSYPGARCPHCEESSGSRLASYTTPELPHLRLRACDGCMGYLILVDLGREPRAIPEVDELAGLPLDLWAVAQGYRKLQPNIAGV